MPLRKFPVAKLIPYPGKQVEELDVELCTGASVLYSPNSAGYLRGGVKKGRKKSRKKGPGHPRVQRYKPGVKKAAVTKPPKPLSRAEKAALRASLYSMQSVNAPNSLA